MKIFISGVHSDPNPSPGIGLARSLKRAYPHSTLVAVDYSNRSSGIHDDIFDDVWIATSWEHANAKTYKKQIKAQLDPETYWISGFDLEVRWLANHLPEEKKILTPPVSALDQIAKPTINAHDRFNFNIPPFVRMTETDWDLHAFCRQHGWKVWLKSEYSDAMRVTSWPGLEHARKSLLKFWPIDKLFLQAHKVGHEETIAYAAYEGELLDCVQFKKRDLTSMGKGWAGQVLPVDPVIRSTLQAVVQDLNWTGGAEIEYVRDKDGGCWLIDWNYRFPAWIHGATIAGHNLPAKLISKISGEGFIQNDLFSSEFTRVVYEIPVRNGYPLPSLKEKSEDSFGWSSKHPSGMSSLAEKLNRKNDSGENQDRPVTYVPPEIIEEIEQYDLLQMQTPQALVLKKVAKQHFGKAQHTIKRIAAEVNLDINIGYSIKTNPSTELLKIARNTGFLAEAISTVEVAHARSMGYPNSEIIFNGPAKNWRTDLDVPQHELKILFCDSLNELHHIATLPQKPDLVGIRLRPSAFDSRFGIPLHSLTHYQKLLEAIALLGDIDLAIHFHFASSILGVEAWYRLFESSLDWAHRIQEDSGCNITLFDLGGGWFPEDWLDNFLPNLADTIFKVKSKLPFLKEVLLEPGKALLQPLGVVVTKILEIRYFEEFDTTEIVVDAAISDLPEVWNYPHRILAYTEEDGWRPLRRGNDAIMGRICMEHDILARNIELPSNIEIGDYLAICDAGAYDRSMRYDFGQGRSAEYQFDSK